MNKYCFGIIFFLWTLFGFHVCAQEYSRLTNLPHVLVNTFDGAAITSKEYYVYATMFYVDENDNVTRYDSMRIRGRGNSTWGVAKKPYRIKFLSKEKFLGKGYAKAKSWTLIANALDKTLLRNALTFKMGEFLGLKNNPASKYVDLTLNGVYMGNYMISDHVEVRAHRVNICEQDYPLTDESDVTGGYLLEVDGFQDGNCFTTSKYKVPVRVHYPDEDEIAEEQNAYIRNFLADFETALSSDNYRDPDEGYRQYVDSVSLANWFIATEVSGNIDGYFSTYFYKERGDQRLYWGPLWDYDIAYANDIRKGDTSSQLMTEVGYGQTKEWLNRMWKDVWFAELINRRYGEVVSAGLEDYLYAQIDSLVELTEESRILNYKKWGISQGYLREYMLYSSYDQYISFLKSYIAKHIPYLTSAFAGKRDEAPTPDFVADESYYYRVVSAKTGMTLSEVSDLACSWSGGYEDNQLWRLFSVGDGYYLVLNKQSGMALCDPTVGEATATTNVGTQLAVAEADAADDSQLWHFTPQGSAGYYNLVNKKTQHTANLSGGASTDGTPVLSYTTDNRNSSSMNRLWYVIAAGEVEKEADGIADVEPDEYALAFDAETKTLRFGGEVPGQLVFVANVYSSAGVLLRTFKASDQCSLFDLPSGVYIVKWRFGNVVRSVKMRL